MKTYSVPDSYGPLLIAPPGTHMRKTWPRMAPPRDGRMFKRWGLMRGLFVTGGILLRLWAPLSLHSIGGYNTVCLTTGPKAVRF